MLDVVGARAAAAEDFRAEARLLHRLEGLHVAFECGQRSLFANRESGDVLCAAVCTRGDRAASNRGGCPLVSPGRVHPRRPGCRCACQRQRRRRRSRRPRPALAAADRSRALRVEVDRLDEPWMLFGEQHRTADLVARQVRGRHADAVDALRRQGFGFAKLRRADADAAFRQLQSGDVGATCESWRAAGWRGRSLVSAACIFEMLRSSLSRSTHRAGVSRSHFEMPFSTSEPPVAKACISPAP